MADQGCPQEGEDRRLFGTVVCWLQRKLSFESDLEPISIVLAFPPYISINIPIPWWEKSEWGVHKVLNFRAGWRMDMGIGNKRMFIFPSAAIKKTSRGLMY